MVFNWFRRSFDKSNASKAEPNPAESVTPQQDSDQAPEPEAEPAPEKSAAAPQSEPKSFADMTPEERLQWAKAAAQTIQKQQAEAKAAETAAVPEPVADEADVESEPVALATPDAPAEAETGEAESLEAESLEESIPEAAIPEVVSGVPEQATPTETTAESAALAEVARVVSGEEDITATSDTTAPEPEAIAAAESTPEDSTPEDSTPEDSTPETPIPESTEEPTLEEPTAEEPAETSEPEPATTIAVPDAEIPTAEAEPETEPEPEGADTETAAASEAVSNLPFWAKAEAERQQRLERLRETAIPEPEPEPIAASVATPAPAEPILPDIDLDEAFLWSAEVLAAQGRRPDDISVEEITWLKRLRQGLSKTRLSLVNQLKAIVGQGPLNDDAVMEIEALLLQADVGVAATDKIIEALQSRMRDQVLPPDQAIAYLKTILRDMLDAPLGNSHNLLFVPEKDALNIWLMTGVNGAGKTTTIGKLAHVATKSGYNTLIAAADTFRAAAVEQVRAWGARSEVEVIANPGKNTDPAAVVYDAIAAAQSRQTELLLVDTAGRLQNKKNLMDELAKIRRIVDKNAPNANIEALLVLDATLGQNGLRQAEVFAEAANLSGVVLTKLDGTAKGGVALAVVEQLGLPIRFIGAGEGIEDLRPFSSYEFIEALLSG